VLGIQVVRGDDAIALGEAGSRRQQRSGEPGAADDKTPVAASSAETPIPGLLVEVREEYNATPLATYQVLTDVDGRLSAEIEVGSSSDIVIESKQNWIARVAVAGPASEFAVEKQAVVRATPMIEAVGACRLRTETDEVVKFTYRNLNQDQSGVFVPITTLEPLLFRRDDIAADDLLLNHIGYSNGNPVLPDARGGTFNRSQKFEPGEQGFTVPYNPALGPLAWVFVGQQVRVDASTAVCTEERTQSCERVSEALLQRIISETRDTITALLKLEARKRAKGTSPFIKSSARSLRSMRSAVTMLGRLHVCPTGIMPQATCTRMRFPYEQLAAIHANIFKIKAEPTGSTHQRLRRAWIKRFGVFIRSSFPDEVVQCQ
jgi:hypothetical protein